MKKFMDENPNNLMKKFIISVTKAKKTSKLILNKKALRFKENIEREINLI